MRETCASRRLFKHHLLCRQYAHFSYAVFFLQPTQRVLPVAAAQKRTPSATTSAAAGMGRLHVERNRARPPMGILRGGLRCCRGRFHTLVGRRHGRRRRRRRQKAHLPPPQRCPEVAEAPDVLRGTGHEVSRGSRVNGASLTLATSWPVPQRGQ